MRTIITVLAALVFPLLGCQDSGSPNGNSADKNGKPVVYTTNYPLFYFAGRIAGKTAVVRFPEIDGDPAFWQPDDQQITDMQGADLILTNGATYEKWAKTISLPPSRTVDTSSGLASSFIEIKDTVTHSHGSDGKHSHTGTAFTTWMDFEQARHQATAVRNALLKLMPDNKETLNTNAGALIADITKLHEEMRSVTTAFGNRPLVASHPVYQYFARQYKLKLKSVLWEPETPPSAEDIANLRKMLEDHPATWMIWEGEPAPKSVALLNDINVKSVVVAPAGNRPDQGDWLSVMKKNIENLRAVVGPPDN